jgi:CHASE3 domain sensor protein
LAERGYVTDPKTWAVAIRDVGPQYAVIFALLAVLGFLAFKGVPAVMDLASAIQRNTDSVLSVQKAEEWNQNIIVKNQGQVIDNETEIIKQHEEMRELLERQQSSVDDLIADEKARQAHEELRRK